MQKPMKKKITNYRRLFAVQKEITEILKRACPNISHNSGIYFYTRVTEKGKAAYIGQSVDILQRSISHLQGYEQKIDISLKKWGFYSPQNEIGWKLNVLYYPVSKLDEMEQFYIKNYRDAGYELYNIESGGTNGKTDIGERKAGKGYRDGLKQGYYNAQKEVSKLFDKNLTYSISGKPNKFKEKALAKFEQFLKIEDIENSNENGSNLNENEEIE